MSTPKHQVPTDEDFRFNTNVQLVVINCGQCGGTYAINERRRQHCYDSGTGWNCPYCKTSWGYYKYNRHAALERELQRTKANLEAESGRAAMLAQEKAQVTRSYEKMRGRIKNGVCPCCNRTFQNLLSHMRTEHPDFGSEKALKTIRELLGLSQSALAKEIGGISQGQVSLYERGKPVSEWAEQRLTGWMEENA